MSLAKYALTPSDDKEKEELGSKLFKDQLANVASSLPVLRELAPAIQGHDYSGPAGFRIFSIAGKAYEKAMDGKVPMRELNQAGGILFHYPPLQLQRLADG